MCVCFVQCFFHVLNDFPRRSADGSLGQQIPQLLATRPFAGRLGRLKNPQIGNQISPQKIEVSPVNPGSLELEDVQSGGLTVKVVWIYWSGQITTTSVRESPKIPLIQIYNNLPRLIFVVSSVVVVPGLLDQETTAPVLNFAEQAQAATAHAARENLRNDMKHLN